MLAVFLPFVFRIRRNSRPGLRDREQGCEAAAVLIGQRASIAKRPGRSAVLSPTLVTCPEIVLTASYHAWVGFLDDGHSIPLRGRGIDDIKETESNIACNYPCPFLWTLGVHGR